MGFLRLFAPYLPLIARRPVKKWSVRSGGDRPLAFDCLTFTDVIFVSFTGLEKTWFRLRVVGR